MKITDVQVYRLTGSMNIEWENFERSVAPLDIYPGEAEKMPMPNIVGDRLRIVKDYVVIQTDEGLEGLYGPIVYKEQSWIIMNNIRSLLIDQNPLHIERIWDQLRFDRHGRNGYFMMALSAIDCALWDLRGKYYQAPVYELLGGPTRTEIPVYASALGFSLEPEKVKERAQFFLKEGYAAQKWFFRYGPSSGGKGKAENIRMARAVREAIGNDESFMLDCWMGWDVPYTLEMMDSLRELQPTWLEEPLLPNQLDGYKVLKERGSMLIAAGEHLYTRKDFKSFFDAGVLQFAQPDPDWTGGITELRKIAYVAEMYDVKFVPHGCTFIPNLHVIASLSPALCPYLEYLVRYQKEQNFFHKYKFEPKNGVIHLPILPGLGIVWDDQAIESKEIVL